MKRTRALTLGAGLALLTTAVIVGTSVARLNANIRASGGFETPVGLFGIATGQTARLNAGNIRASGGFESQSGGFEKPSPACIAALHFFDMDGTPVASRVVRLEAGKGAFLDFALPPPMGDTSETAMMRAQLRATVRYRSEDPSVPCQVQTTLEVINNMTARTMVFAQALASSGLPTGSSRIDIEPEQ